MYQTPKMRRVIVQMPPSFHDDVKRIAAGQRVSVSEAVRLALGRWKPSPLISGWEHDD